MFFLSWSEGKFLGDCHWTLDKTNHDNETKYRQLVLEDFCGKFISFTKTHTHVKPSVLTENGRSVPQNDTHAEYHIPWNQARLMNLR